MMGGIMDFPAFRSRRMRATEQHRRMVRETQLATDDLIFPMFVTHGKGVRNEISAMPGVAHMSVDLAVKEAQEVYNLGIPAVLLFGIPGRKDAKGSEAYAKDGIVQQAVRAIKENVSGLVVITDVCLCEYTDHGHCGVVEANKVLNDPSLELLGKAALSHAEAGADMVAPSDMMDGRVAAIRKILDEKGYEQLPILSYAAKFASGFYGPFREAAGSAPQFGDRKSYQMDPPNVREALREIEMDIQEGADIVMVKPALAYLDVIQLARQKFNRPIAAYSVSGEYAMVKAAAERGWIDEGQVVREILTAIKRAGADLILTYFAKNVATWMRS
jgi:porphobilinogen synthase